MNKEICTFDIDGVILFDEFGFGIHPGPNDIIITGRSIEESAKTLSLLRDEGIFNTIYFNPIPFFKKTRESSGEHKVNCLNLLVNSLGYAIKAHFEDDPIQADIIEKAGYRVVRVISPYTELENKDRS